MTEAIFGFIGVIVGSLVPWIKDSWTEKRMQDRSAKYLAIRVACNLSKYVSNCAEVVSDDGTCMGQPANADGTLSPQVKAPVHPLYPDDVDWKSIDASLMYSILSLPNEAEFADRAIDAAAEHASPPDYEEFFEERQYQYACLGLKALDLEKKIRTTYGIPERQRNEWNPYDHFISGKNAVEKNRADRQRASEEFMQQMPVTGGNKT